MIFEVNIENEKIKIETHERPHLDELVAIWLIDKFGSKEFVKKYAEDKQNTIEIGIGGGLFDEHSSVNTARKEGESAATLVAKALKIENDPALQALLKFVTERDLKGGRQPFDLDWAVQLLNSEVQDFQVVYDWLTFLLEPYYQQQVKFFADTREEFEKVAQTENVLGPNGKNYKMVTVISDNEQMNKVARQEGAAIIIQKNTSGNGNVQIFTNQKYRLTLFDIVQIIRLEEQQKKGKLITTDWRLLSQEGTIPGVEEWYFQIQGQMMLNGSLSHPEVPATKLTLEEIKKFIRIGLNPNAYENSHFQNCKKGICTSTQKNPCPYYAYGLSRCRKIRYAMNSKLMNSAFNPSTHSNSFSSNSTPKKRKPIIIKF
ncbi:MAG: hypothetical protein KBG30_11725 [Bacteroidales bacterium]|jgi:hypothetical protein|nr:hypothetical protein [Bacteroidales bacterium]